MQGLVFFALLFIQMPVMWARLTPEIGNNNNCPVNSYRCGSDRDCARGQVCCGSRCGPVCKDRGSCITCANARCTQGYVCIETAYGPECVRSAPIPQPIPVPRPGPIIKPGMCPPTGSDWAGNVGPYGSVGPCTYQCKPPGDGDCRGDLKCCPSPCGGSYCARPVQPAPTCENVNCPFGQKCVLKQVVCVTAPCYPQPTCVSAMMNGYRIGGGGFPWF